MENFFNEKFGKLTEEELHRIAAGQIGETLASLSIHKKTSIHCSDGRGRMVFCFVEDDIEFFFRRYEKNGEWQSFISMRLDGLGKFEDFVPICSIFGLSHTEEFTKICIEKLQEMLKIAYFTPFYLMKNEQKNICTEILKITRAYRRVYPAKDEL